VVVDVHKDGECLLVLAIDAKGLASFFFGARESGQEHCGQDSDDSDYDQELDEGECFLLLHAVQLRGKNSLWQPKVKVIPS